MVIIVMHTKTKRTLNENSKIVFGSVCIICMRSMYELIHNVRGRAIVATCGIDAGTVLLVDE